MFIKSFCLSILFNLNNITAISRHFQYIEIISYTFYVFFVVIHKDSVVGNVNFGFSFPKSNTKLANMLSLHAVFYRGHTPHISQQQFMHMYERFACYTAAIDRMNIL